MASTLCVNNVTFLTSTSNHMHYGTSNAIDNLKIIPLEEGSKNAIQWYVLRGFKVVAVLVDIQFKCLKDRNKLRTPVNVVIRGEHVKQIERFHRMIDERVRWHFSMLPFNALTTMMVVHLIATVAFYSNAFAWMNVVSKFLLHLNIADGAALDHHLHFRNAYGEFL